MLNRILGSERYVTTDASVQSFEHTVGRSNPCSFLSYANASGTAGSVFSSNRDWQGCLFIESETQSLQVSSSSLDELVQFSSSEPTSEGSKEVVGRRRLMMG